MDNGTPNWTECPLLPRQCSVCSSKNPFPITHRTHEVNDHNTSAPLCSAFRLLYSLSFNPLAAARSISAGSEPPASRTGLVVARWLFIPPRSAVRLVFEAESSRCPSLIADKRSVSVRRDRAQTDALCFTLLLSICHKTVTCASTSHLSPVLFRCWILSQGLHMTSGTNPGRVFLRSPPSAEPLRNVTFLRQMCELC